MDTESAIPILFSDDALLVVNKPAGLPTLPDGWQPDAPCLVRMLQAAHGRLWVVHRLDRPTSGVIVLARTAEAHRALNLQFDAHTVRKTYHALSVGTPKWDELRVALPLRADGDRRHRTVIDHGRGKPAVTHLRVLARLGPCALIEARPETGRTHQIRAHLAALGLPLAADELYGGPPGFIERPALHAQALAFSHPVGGAAVAFEAPYPDDLTAALARLRAEA